MDRIVASHNGGRALECSSILYKSVCPLWVINGQPATQRLVWSSRNTIWVGRTNRSATRSTDITITM
jgi:hypothetical protein